MDWLKSYLSYFQVPTKSKLSSSQLFAVLKHPNSWYIRLKVIRNNELTILWSIKVKKTLSPQSSCLESSSRQYTKSPSTQYQRSHNQQTIHIIHYQVQLLPNTKISQTHSIYNITSLTFSWSYHMFLNKDLRSTLQSHALASACYIYSFYPLTWLIHNRVAL